MHYYLSRTVNSFGATYITHEAREPKTTATLKSKLSTPNLICNYYKDDKLVYEISKARSFNISFTNNYNIAKISKDGKEEVGTLIDKTIKTSLFKRHHYRVLKLNGTILSIYKVEHDIYVVCLEDKPLENPPLRVALLEKLIKPVDKSSTYEITLTDSKLYDELNLVVLSLDMEEYINYGAMVSKPIKHAPNTQPKEDIINSKYDPTFKNYVWAIDGSNEHMSDK